MKNEIYKKISLDQFNKEALNFDDADSYKMCKEDYPEILEELEKEMFHDVLDCGCGTGAMLALLSAKYPNKSYTGIDLSDQMIKVAKKKNPETISFVIGDCENLPFEDLSFDVVICSHSFHHYPDPQSFFNNVYRILRPEGRLILRDNTGPWYWNLYMNWYVFPKGNRRHRLGDVHCYNRKEVKALCEKAGLSMELFEERPKHKMHCVARKK